MAEPEDGRAKIVEIGFVHERSTLRNPKERRSRMGPKTWGGVEQRNPIKENATSFWAGPNSLAEY